jgi:uncharacterized protein (TIGR02271 family)
MISDADTPDDVPTKHPQTARDISAEPPAVLRLLKEELSVERERVETGRVRVRVTTHDHEETVSVPLTHEYVEVERVPINRDIDEIPPRRQEGDTTIVPVVEEVVIVRRKLVLKEEIHLRLVRSTEQHQESVTLRRQEAVIERIPVEQSSTGQKSD